MVFIDGVKYACDTCIRGHRVTTCTHKDRPLTMIKPKGRPVSQCSHCREARKSRALHTRCECGELKSDKHSCSCSTGASCTCFKMKNAGRPPSAEVALKGCHTVGVKNSTVTSKPHQHGNSPYIMAEKHVASTPATAIGTPLDKDAKPARADSLPGAGVFAPGLAVPGFLAPTSPTPSIDSFSSSSLTLGSTAASSTSDFAQLHDFVGFPDVVAGDSSTLVPDSATFAVNFADFAQTAPKFPYTLPAAVPPAAPAPPATLNNTFSIADSLALADPLAMAKPELAGIDSLTFIRQLLGEETFLSGSESDASSHDEVFDDDTLGLPEFASAGLPALPRRAPPTPVARASGPPPAPASAAGAAGEEHAMFTDMFNNLGKDFFFPAVASAPTASGSASPLAGAASPAPALQPRAPASVLDYDLQFGIPPYFSPMHPVVFE
ncbi:uncharacterized protein V1510DRAFT_410777 [Dipodascopsis tothii]|uniref:uncharacterized protein n=1 Tax=Dipodascopsis tothii TaxID=44089 RepID=UPI0034CD6B55